MMLDYINEAFKSLDLLTEDVFKADSEGINELSDFINDDEAEETISIIDMDAETEDDLQDSYVGKVIVDCNVCHSHVFKNKEDIKLDDDGVVNIEKDCPYCGDNNGFVIIGEIHEFNPKSEEEVENSEEEIENSEEEIEEINDSIEESLNLDPSIAARFTKPQLDSLTAEEIKILKSHDREAINKIIAKYNLETNKENLIEAAPRKYKPSTIRLLKMIGSPLADGLEESLEESFKNVSLETEDQIMTMTSEDNGKVTVTTEPTTTEATEGEVITPVSSETEEEIIDANAEVIDEPFEEETPAEEEVDFDFEEVDEDSMSELGESYLKRVYENVDSFKLTSCSTTPTQLVLEGLITFKSGVKKNTGFIFEAKDATRDGKLRFIGENAHLCRGRKAFTLVGSMNDKKLMCESFTYNYRAKNADGKSTRVYGKVTKSK